MDVFVTFADEFDLRCLGEFPELRVHTVGRAPDHWRPTPGFDPLAYLEECRRYLDRRPVDAIVSYHDLGDLVAAVLARERGLPGAEPEAVFRCLHKYYARRAEAAPVACRVLDLAAPDPGGLRYPCYLKAPWLKLGLLGFKLEGPEDLERALALARREYPAWARQYYPLFRAAVDVERFSLAVRDVLLVEEFVDGPQVTVEGWMDGGSFHLWAITDTLTFPGGRAIDGFCLPTARPPAEARRLAAAAGEAARRMGFGHGFFNAEFWCLEGGPVLTEINGRAAGSFEGLYRRCLGASVYRAAALLAGGGEVRPPRPTGVAGGQFNLLAFTPGRAADLFDFQAARGEPEVSPFVAEGDEVRPVSEFGVVLAQAEIFGAGRDGIHRRAGDLRRRLLRRS